MSARTTRSLLRPCVVAVAAASLLAGCADDGDPADGDVTVEDVAEIDTDPEDPAADLLEQTVTVSGRVLEIVEPGAFLLGSEGVFEPEVLVLSPTTDFSDAGLAVTDLLVEDQTLVEVTGTVRELNLGQFQADYAIPYEPEVYEEYAGQAVIVAETLTAVDP